MTRQERLKHCKTCQKREFDFNKGILCSITNDYADFEESCPDYMLDEKVQILEAFKSEQADNEKKKIQKRKEKKKQRKSSRKRMPEKIRRDDLWLILGSSLITVFILRITYYANYSYSGEYHTLYVVLIFFLSSVITLLLRKKEKWRYRVFGDIKFKAIFSIAIAVIYSLYVLIVHTNNFRIGAAFLVALVWCFIMSLFAGIIVIPVSLILQKTCKSNVHTQ